MPVAERAPVLTETLTPAQYLVQERLAEAKSEYIDGELLPMPGVSIEHDRIVRSILRSLENQLSAENCEPMTSDVRVQLSGSRYVYPDLTVVCGTPVFTDSEVDTLVNPSAIFEVLSNSTLNYDLGEKARLYRQRESLQSLCLVAQDRPWVEVWTREEGNSWRVREFTGLDTTAELPALSLSLPLSDIYRRVTFAP
ncbi:Uma2 family endonuclease [Armatimonas sp.]|uniref:Uma2 family endonuclease n=1 Tax=Armatimonas sp. TaxID=1872638 RepID=UPI003752F29C